MVEALALEVVLDDGEAPLDSVVLGRCRHAEYAGDVHLPESIAKPVGSVHGQPIEVESEWHVVHLVRHDLDLGE